MSLWRDPFDSTAYFIRSCDNSYTGISRLTKDYLNSTGLISRHPVFEGMALFRHPNGTYYCIGSHLTGWNPNPLMLFRAAGATLDDPQWVNMGNPTRDATSFNSQPTYVVSFMPASGDAYFVYMADNCAPLREKLVAWPLSSLFSPRGSAAPPREGPALMSALVDSDPCVVPPGVHGGPAGLIDASYAWLPLQFGEHEVTLERRETWDLDDPFGEHGRARHDVVEGEVVSEQREPTKER
mmetsp:Transcript_6711/g.20136  ORF Transcript_6711/g.20136 Transcript_6711/m.20136 type:complete len:239 (-) Transcript_6711:385-1101(-)